MDLPGLPLGVQAGIGEVQVIYDRRRPIPRWLFRLPLPLPVLLIIYLVVVR
jgi:hypothetical protein